MITHGLGLNRVCMCLRRLPCLNILMEVRVLGKWAGGSQQLSANLSSYYGNLIVLPPSLRGCTFKLGMSLLDFCVGLAEEEEAF